MPIVRALNILKMTRTLARRLPEKKRRAVPLALLFDLLLNEQLTQKEFEESIQEYPELQSALNKLVNTKIVVKKGVSITIGNNSQAGDITIGNIIGGNYIVKHIYLPPISLEVSHSSPTEPLHITQIRPSLLWGNGLVLVFIVLLGQFALPPILIGLIVCGVIGFLCISIWYHSLSTLAPDQIGRMSLVAFCCGIFVGPFVAAFDPIVLQVLAWMGVSDLSVKDFIWNLGVTGLATASWIGAIGALTIEHGYALIRKLLPRRPSQRRGCLPFAGKPKKQSAQRG